MSILVTGGAGYIGSHMTHALVEQGERVIVLDNLSTGVRSLVSRDAIFEDGDVNDLDLVRRILRQNRIVSVFHFAGSVIVPESVAKPLLYYKNNTAASRTLIECCVAEGVNNFIFSSTAAVYGVPGTESVCENTPTSPINPYGRSKLMTEWILDDTSRANPSFRHTILRYFNVAGADNKGRTGQSTPNATHLIKRACQVALGRVSHLDIYGNDYATPDGTGIRDYIHVTDLVSAHLLTLEALRNGKPSDCYNCGYGSGISVKQVISAVEKVTGKELPVRLCPRRDGDPASIVATSNKLKSTLKWSPNYNDLDTIVRTAFEWERKLHLDHN